METNKKSQKNSYKKAGQNASAPPQTTARESASPQSTPPYLGMTRNQVRRKHAVEDFKEALPMLLEDGSFLLMAIVTIAFHDKTKILIATQLLFALIQYMSVRRKGQGLTFAIRWDVKVYLLWGVSFAAYALLSYVWADTRKVVIGNTASILQVVLLGSALLIYVKDEEHYRRAVRYLTIASLTLCARLFVAVPKEAFGKDRVGEYIGYGKVTVTYNLSYTSIFAFDEGIKQKKWIYYPASIIMIVFSCLSGSKKALIIAALAIPLLIVMRSKNPIETVRNIAVAIGAVALAWLALLYVPALHNSVYVRFEKMLGYMSGTTWDASTDARSTLVGLAWNAFKAHPICGLGLGEFQFTNALNYYAHNNYLELLSCLGIIGFTMYYIYPAAIFVKGITGACARKNKNYITTFIVLTSLLAMDVATVSYSLEPIHITLALLYANNRLTSQQEAADFAVYKQRLFTGTTPTGMAENIEKS